jgi:hypothetical protein
MSVLTNHQVGTERVVHKGDLEGYEVPTLRRFVMIFSVSHCRSLSVEGHYVG